MFNADEGSIFGTPNEDYIARELAWYESMSLNVNDIPGETPTIWKHVSSTKDEINSNYGWCIWSPENYSQYEHCAVQLRRDSYSRRAVMIYNRPEMQYEYNREGMSDFMCTYAVQYMIRDNKLNAHVIMRSNDAWAGYRNDYAWQEHVLVKLFEDLVTFKPELQCGDIFWNAMSLHVYENNFYLLDHYNQTGETTISKSEYIKLYGEARLTGL